MLVTQKEMSVSFLAFQEAQYTVCSVLTRLDDFTTLPTSQNPEAENASLRKIRRMKWKKSSTEKVYKVMH